MPAKALPISVCIIVRNEADRLPAFLEPLKGRFEQIVAYVNDTNDNSVQQLKEAGVEVVEGPWLGFAQTRKAVWAMAAFPWIFWLDADEVVPSQLIDALENVGQEEGVGGYEICRQISFMGKVITHGEWGRDWVLRVFPADNWTMDNVHVHESVALKSGRVRKLPGLVAHHSFRSWEDLQARSQRYISLWVQDALARKKRPAKLPGLRAFLRFLRAYVLKAGFLDGVLGWKIAMHNAREVYAKHVELIKAMKKAL